MKKGLKNKIIVTSAMVGAVVAAPAIVGAIDDQSDLDLSGTVGLDQLENKALAFAGGTGTVEDPYLIANATELQAMKDDLLAHYKLTQDISLAGQSWTPLGEGKTPFKGSFDGDGHVIKYLSTSITGTGYSGFFGYVENLSNPVVIKNVTFDSPNIVATSGVIGIVAAYAKNADFDNVHVKRGNISDITSNTSNVGGFVGKSENNNFRNLSVEVDIKSNIISTNVTSTKDYIGGLIGYHTENSTNNKNVISNVSVKGNITGNHVNSVGGVIGYSYTNTKLKMKDIVSDVNISMSAFIAGGLIGQYYATSEGNEEERYLRNVVIYGKVINNLSKDSIKPYSPQTYAVMGGESRYLTKYVTNLYILNDTIQGNNLVAQLYSGNNQLLAEGLINTEGTVSKDFLSKELSLSEAEKEETYSKYGFDFKNTWKMGNNGEGPMLKIQDVNGLLDVTTDSKFAGGDGTIQNPFLISNAEQFQSIKNNLTKHYKLIGDIDFKNVAFEPIATDTAFTGTLNGNGFTIKNINIQDSNVANTAIFGLVSTHAVIKNLVLDNINISSNFKKSSTTGALVGQLTDATIQNVTLKNSEISDVSTGVSTQNTKYVGGLIGSVVDNILNKNGGKGSSIKDINISNVNVTSAFYYVGGLVGLVKGATAQSTSNGESYAKFNNIYVDTQVTSSSVSSSGTASYMGLLGGSMSGVHISDVVTKGTIQGDKNFVGGIIGLLAKSINSKNLVTYANVISNPIITKENYLSNYGGLFGKLETSDVANVFAYNKDINVEHKTDQYKKYSTIGELYNNTKATNIYLSDSISSTIPDGTYTSKLNQSQMKDAGTYNKIFDMDGVWGLDVNGLPTLRISDEKIIERNDSTIPNNEKTFLAALRLFKLAEKDYSYSAVENAIDAYYSLDTTYKPLMEERYNQLIVNKNTINVLNGSIQTLENNIKSSDAVVQFYAIVEQIEKLTSSIDTTSMYGERLEELYQKVRLAKAVAAGLFEDDSLDKATKAVEKAEQSKLQEDIDTAQNLVAALDDSTDKNALQSRLDKVKALLEATKAVEKAETSKAESDLNDAQTKVTALKDSPEKVTLQERLDKLKALIEAQHALKAATDAVVDAENYKNESYINTAQGLVEKLPDSPEKQALQKRIDAVVEGSKLILATKAVEKAETSKAESDINDAQTKVTALKDSPDKNALQDRLDKLKTELAETEADKTALTEATKAVEKAETSKAESDINDAQTKVTALKDSSDKNALQDRLDKLKTELAETEADKTALTEATKAVEKAETSKAESDINDAQTKVTALKDSSDKQALQDRLDKLKTELAETEADKTALTEATKAVEKAETSKAESDINNAQTKVTALKDLPEKVTLQERLDKLRGDIEDTSLFEKLLGEVKGINQNILVGKVRVDEFNKKKVVLGGIRKECEAIKNTANKEQVNVLIDVTLSLMILVDKIEGGDKAIDTIGQLPDSKIKDKYLSEVAENDALVAAEKAVVKAEDTIALADIETAEGLVVKLAPSDKKKELNNRLDTVKALYGQIQAIAEATKLVEQAENTLRLSDIERAEKAVKNLKDGSEKTALMARIDVLYKKADSLAYDAALKAVEKAEALRLNDALAYAKEKVAGLRKSTEKTALEERIKALEKSIYTQAEMDRLYKQALEAVEKAERSTIILYLSKAIELTKKVSDADVRKQDLVDRVNAIVLRNQITTVDSELGRLELRPSQSGVEKVQGLIDSLPNSAGEKNAFQTRLDAVKRALDNENYAKALKGVEFLESTKIENKRATYYSVLPLVDVLLDGERKTALEKRLAKVLAEVEAYEKLDGDYAPGDSVVESAQSIKDAKVKPLVLAWAKAVENAEYYYSNTLVNALIKAEQSIPKEIFDNLKYEDLVKELTERSAHIKASSKVFNSLVARGVIKNVYVVVLTFEDDRTEAKKKNALAMANDLKRFKGHEEQVEKLIVRIERIKIETK